MKKLISIIVIICLIISYSFNTFAVAINVSKDVKVDTAVINNDNYLNQETYKIDLKNKTMSIFKNIDISFNSLQQNYFSINSASAQDIMNTWSQWGGGNWRVESDGYLHNYDNTPQFTGFCYPSTSVVNMSIEYDFTAKDGDDDFVGILFRCPIITEEDSLYKDNVLSGYLVIESGGDNIWGFGDELNQSRLSGIYKLTDCPIIVAEGDVAALPTSTSLLHNFLKEKQRIGSKWLLSWSMLENNEYVTQYKSLNGKYWRKNTGTDNLWLKRKYEINGNTIKTTAYKGRRELTDNLEIDWVDETKIDDRFTTGSFSFINFSQPIKYTNVKISLEEQKDLNNILNNFTWRDNSIRLINRIDNVYDFDYTAPIISRSLNDNLNYIFFTNEQLKDKLAKYINIIDDNGRITFYKKEAINDS